MLPLRSLCDYEWRKKSKAMTDQIMTVSKSRLKSKIVMLSNDDMTMILKAIRMQLYL